MGKILTYSESNESDKRRHKRYILDPMDIHCDMVFATDVTLLDISFGGISVKADKRLNIGCDYIIKIRAEGNVMNLRGGVVWSVLSAQKDTLKGDVLPI